MQPPQSAPVDPSLAHEGARRIDYAQTSMPVLARLRARLAQARPLAGEVVAASVHVTAETAVLARTLKAAGAAVHLAASNPFSTQDDVVAALLAEGVGVFARHGADRATHEAHRQAVVATRPTLVLDDGCDLVAALHAGTQAALRRVRAGCEQTSTGVLRLRQMSADGELRLPVVAVNDTPVQLLVANRHGTGQSTIDAVVRATGVLLAGATVVVAGYGWCGAGVAARARGLGARVVVTEVDAGRALEALLDGHQVLPMAEALPGADVVVTTTGCRDVVAAHHLPLLRDGAVLANAGHFDVEVDVRALAAAATVVSRQVRPHVDAYHLPDGRRVLLLAEGRLVNLAAAEGHPPPVMDVSYAVQVLTLERLVATPRRRPGVHDVPAGIDDEVARTRLAASGARLDTLTASQAAYLSTWRSGEPGT